MPSPTRGHMAGSSTNDAVSAGRAVGSFRKSRLFTTVTFAAVSRTSDGVAEGGSAEVTGTESPVGSPDCVDDPAQADAARAESARSE